MSDADGLINPKGFGLEPNLKQLFNDYPEPREYFLASIAVSLKRIADEVCGKQDGSTMKLTDCIMVAIEQGILNASNRG